MRLDNTIQGVSIGKGKNKDIWRLSPGTSLQREVSWREKTNRGYSRGGQWQRGESKKSGIPKQNEVRYDVWDTIMELGIRGQIEAKNIARVQETGILEGLSLWIFQKPRMLIVLMSETVIMSQEWKIFKGWGEAGATRSLQTSTVWWHQLPSQVK